MVSSEALSMYRLLQQSEYRVSFKGLRPLIELAVENESKTRTTFGPNYYIKTSKGIPLILTTFRFSHNEQFRRDDDSIAVIATHEETGEVLGDRVNTIYRHANKPHVWSTFGQININTRGDGIAKPIELVLIDLLQRFANEGNTIYWGIEDDNYKRLLTSRLLLKASINDEDHQLLPLLEEEHERWLSLYSDRGTLGFEKGEGGEMQYSRSFGSSLAPDIAMKNIESVRFKINQHEQNKRELSKMGVLEEIPVTDMKVHRERRIAELKHIYSLA